MKHLLKFVTICLFISAIFIDVRAQSSGSLRGAVTDSRGAAVKGARVVLLYSSKLAVRETLTNERGVFGFSDLMTGVYSVAVEAEGLTQSGGAQPIKVEAGRELQMIIPLTVAAIKDAVIVSATRTDSLMGENPASAYLISAAELLRTQRVSLFDALRYSPGVTIAQTSRRGGVTSLFVRGGESDYAKILIDGVPVNEAGGSFDFADLTADNASRVELIRGAQSAIYGSDAMTGVVQFFTHRGTTATPEIEYSGEGGSFGFSRQFAKISGVNGAFDYSTSFTHIRTDGRDRNDDYQNRIATANLGYRFNERAQLRLTARNSKSGLGVPGATAVFFPDPDERAKRRNFTLGAKIEDQTTNFWRQSLTFAYSESNYLSFDPVAQDLTNPGVPLDPGVAFNDFSAYFNNHQRRRGLRYQSDLALPSGHFITAGIDFEQERAVFDNGFTGSNRVASDRRNLGAYIQDQFSYGPRLFITAGIRIENNRADLPSGFAQVLNNLGSAQYSGSAGFGSEVMPKISAIYILRQSGIQSRRGPTKLKVNYGEGIKAPSLVEAFSPSPFFLGNPDLKPERSRNFDLGIEQYFWKDRIRFEATYFENKFRDQIAFAANPATFGGPVKLSDGRLTHYVNNDRSRARGMEISTMWHPKRWFQIGGSYTYLETELLEAADIVDYNTLTLIPNPEVGLPLLRRPKHSGTMHVAFNLDKFDVNMIGYFIGERRDGDPATFSRFDAAGNPIYNDGYAKVDLNGAYRLNSWISFFARIENLFNNNYQEVLGYPAYRLNFSAGMRFRFGGGR